MKLRELLNLMTNVGTTNDIKSYIVGGVPRDRLLNLIKPGEIIDLDITTGDKKVHNLAKEVELELKKTYNISVKHGDDGHTSIIFPGNKFKLDFSSNFLLPDIDKYLLKKAIKNPTDLQREMFSRDFTVNSLLLTLDLKNIKDPTRMGIRDINKKIIKTCLNPDLTLRYNTNRIIRTIYLSAKLDFDVDPEIIRWISEHKDFIRTSTDGFLIKNLDKAMDKNPDRAVYLINKMNLWDVLPITNKLQPYVNKKQANLIFKDARKTEDLAILQSNIGNYIHFSNSERFGISFHKDINPGNPRGVYGFPLTQNIFDIINNKKSNHFYDYGYKKYIYIFNVNGNIFDLDNFDFPNIMDNIKKFIHKQYNSKLRESDLSYMDSFLIPSTYSGKESHKLMRFLRDIVRILNNRKVIINEHSALNVILRGIGYDAVQTKSEGFADDLTAQIVGLIPTAINLITKINNPMLTKNDLIEIKELERKQAARNFDYGEGFYSNMDKYDGVEDFRLGLRKKKRNKRIKLLKKIRKTK